jgi:hypothetical protein
MLMRNLVALDLKSYKEIMPEWPQLKVDTIPVVPNRRNCLS